MSGAIRIIALTSYDGPKRILFASPFLWRGVARDIFNQGFLGEDQSWFRAFNQINGISVKFMDGNIKANGVQVGNMPIDLN